MDSNMNLPEIARCTNNVVETQKLEAITREKHQV